MFAAPERGEGSCQRLSSIRVCIDKFLQGKDEMSMNGVWMVAEPFLGYESLAMAELLIKRGASPTVRDQVYFPELVFCR